jgi:hypothetical protein
MFLKLRDIYYMLLNFVKLRDSNSMWLNFVKLRDSYYKKKEY